MLRHLLACRSSSRCEVCGRQIDANREGSAHHRLPAGKGGTSSPERNRLDRLILACGDGVRFCHGWVESNRTVAYATGLLLRHPARLADEDQLLALTPVVLWSGRVRLLDALGPHYLDPPGGPRWEMPPLQRQVSEGLARIG